MKPSQILKLIAGNLTRYVIAGGLLALVGCATKEGSLLSSAGNDRFERVDANHDGKLSRAEASDYLATEIFEARDLNHDGILTEKEWASGSATLKADFKKRDLNHDRKITKAEAIKYGRNYGAVNKLMDEADKNHDGRLTRAEVKAYYASKEGPIH